MSSRVKAAMLLVCPMGRRCGMRVSSCAWKIIAVCARYSTVLLSAASDSTATRSLSTSLSAKVARKHSSRRMVSIRGSVVVSTGGGGGGRACTAAGACAAAAAGTKAGPAAADGSTSGPTSWNDVARTSVVALESALYAMPRTVSARRNASGSGNASVPQKTACSTTCARPCSRSASHRLPAFTKSVASTSFGGKAFGSSTSRRPDASALVCSDGSRGSGAELPSQEEEGEGDEDEEDDAEDDEDEEGEDEEEEVEEEDEEGDAIASELPGRAVVLLRRAPARLSLAFLVPEFKGSPCDAQTAA